MQFGQLKRREFITLICGAAGTWPLAARGQQGQRVRRVCILEGISADSPGVKTRYAAFLEGLQQLGWTPGRNVQIEVRYAKGDEGALRKYAAELVALAPDVLVAAGGTPTEVALKVTRTIPIQYRCPSPRWVTHGSQCAVITNDFLPEPIGSPLVRVLFTKGMIAADFLGDPTGAISMSLARRQD